ncbi:DoxX family protein [Streptomyces sp. NBC_01142]|uniref:DoxX family protein n=1 Tax=Streptomyces sp. NBC_01142 TaxID=2975865 RepID=UPI002257414E|nr:DoxX family protein [Streptomyces sp. NBC_01142]MCX4821332.1 DoxX family protein [Streptomyces sp. NBC_01142]
MTSTSRTPTPPATARDAPSPGAYDVGLLLLRLAVGLTMAGHGAQKLFGWFDGPGIHGTGQFFELSGYPHGDAMALLAGLSETLGGLGLVLGLLTPLAGAAIVGTMINVIAVKWGGGFFGPRGIEFELLLMVSAATLTLTGPGRYALDHFIPVLRAHRLVYGALAIVLAAVAAAVVLLIRG